MKHYFLCTLFIVHWLVCYGQEYERGLIFDDAAYDDFEMIFPEISRSYAALPEQISLKPFCPYPQKQKGGTCVAWASAYAARTISDAIINNWSNRKIITQEAFSPYFLYFYIKKGFDIHCDIGSHINDAINQMAIRGVPKHTDFQIACPAGIPSEVQSKAKTYRIAGGASLYRSSDPASFKIDAIKRALSQKKPVITAITCPPSFDTPIGDQWIPRSSENPAYPF
ncbi:MAG: cysteine protease, partial [Saprospiraceae bacterium]